MRDTTQGATLDTGTQPSDGDLIARVLDGNTDAYATLVRRYAALARRTAVLLGAGDDADDIVQESWVKAYRALGRYRLQSAFKPWLLRIVSNEVRNHLRSARRRQARERSSASLSVDIAARWADAVDPSATALSAQRRAQLLAAVSTLSDSHRMVVTCRYLLDLDEAETAATLGWPRGTVKSRLHRALRRLRSELDTQAASKEADHAT